MMMVPQAWEKYADLDPAVKAFYEYHQCVLEPWDGPAAHRVHRWRARRRVGGPQRPPPLAATRCGATAWWCSGSEVGLVDLDPREVVECGKVGPGEVLVVDTRRGEVIRNLDAKREVAARRPYARWVARYMATLVPDPARVPPVDTRRGAASAPSGASAMASRICGSCSSRWAAPAPTRSGAWATTRRSHRSRRCRRASTPTSGSASRR